MQLLTCKKIKEYELEKLKKITIDKDLKLVIIKIGDFPENVVYLNSKKKLAELLDIEIIEYSHSEITSKEEIISKIKECNEDNKITGIMIQKPIIEKFNYQELVDYINPLKDVDGVTTYNQESIKIIPPTVRAILLLINNYNITLENKKIAIIGKSNLVGYPLYKLLKDKYHVTLCDSKTSDIKGIITASDIIITAIGRANYFTKDYFKDNQIIIDVGTNYLNGKLVGDVDLNNIDSNVSITPVPGGIGLLTPVCLFLNLLDMNGEV